MKTLIDRFKNGNETVRDPLYNNDFSYGRVIVEKDKCNGCEECQNKCITKAIGINGNKAEVDFRKCIYCGNCVSLCRNNAISMTNDYKMAELLEAGNELRSKIYSRFKRSLVLRSVDTGSCNGCMMELSATQNTYYDISRFGISFAASPRHADGIVVTGPVTINMKEALIKTYNAVSEPKIVVAMGACGYDGGIFKDAYGNYEELSKLLPLDVLIPGCPPSPQAIIYGLLNMMNKKL